MKKSATGTWRAVLSLPYSTKVNNLLRCLLRLESSAQFMYGKTSAKQEVRANFSKVDLDSSKNHTVVLILGKHFKQALVEIASCKKPICKRSWQPKMNSQRNCQIQIQTNLTRGVCKSTKLLKQDTNLGVILCRATVIVQLPFNTLWINSRG